MTLPDGPPHICHSGSVLTFQVTWSQGVPEPSLSKVQVSGLVGAVTIGGSALGNIGAANGIASVSIHGEFSAQIVTSGGKRREPDEIAALAGVAKGMNVFTLDLDRARQRLVADPWISDFSFANSDLRMAASAAMLSSSAGAPSAM